ncbi:17829_t:CDS:2, partial [Cetraspora pellucida]
MSEIQGYEYDFDKSYMDYELLEDGINLVLSELIAIDDDLSVIEEGKNLVSENGSLDNEPEDSPLKEIYIGQTFVSFDMLEQCLKRYSTRMGFEMKIVRAEKEDNIFICKTYKCRHSGKYLSKKKLDSTQNRDRESGRIEYEFTINALYRKHMNLVFVNKFIENHNHILNKEELHLQFSPSLPGAQIKNDASTLYEYLSKVQQENPDWYFKVDFEGIDNRLFRIFWMSSDQRRLWAWFYDVIINDNTCKTNKYMMLLSIFIVIDSNNRSRIAATAVVSDEMVSTYEWILKQTKLATNGLQPTIIFTDTDPVMQVAITNEYPEAIVRHCAFHIRQNLVKRLKKKLNNRWDNFISDFYALRNSLVVSDFDRQCWAHAFTKCKFSANTHSIQRVKCINRIIKLEANSGSSLCQLQAGIDLRLKDEIKYAKLQEFRNMNPTTGLPHVFNTIFKKINDMCVKYLTPNSLALQRKQILESLLYRSLLHNNELNVSASQQLDHKVGFIEDDYEEPQILLNIALEDCSDSLVQSKSKSLPTVTFETLKRIRGQEVNSKIAVKSDSKKVSYGRELGICKKALNITIMNGINKVLEDLLQHFINEQVLAQSSSTASNLSEQGIGQEINSFIISNPSQHKGKGHPANKRYLSAIENQNNKL